MLFLFNLYDDPTHPRHGGPQKLNSFYFKRFASCLFPSAAPLQIKTSHFGCGILTNLFFPYKPQMKFFIISPNQQKNRTSLLNFAY